MAVNMKIAVFWDLTPGSSVTHNDIFQEPCAHMLSLEE